MLPVTDPNNSSGFQDGSATTDCTACGIELRAPQWGREYRCPECGSALRARSVLKPASQSSRLVYLAAGGAVLIAAGVLAVNLVTRQHTDAGSAVRSRSRDVAVRPAEYMPPAGVEDKLRRKITWLLTDLGKAPQHPVLLNRVCEDYLTLSVLVRTRDPEASRRYVDRAARFADRLRQVAPQLAAPLEGPLREPDRYVLAPPPVTPGGPGTPSSDRPNVPRRNSNILYRQWRREGAKPLWARDEAGAKKPAGLRPSRAEMWDADEAELTQLRGQWRNQPGHVRIADRLGATLERQASRLLRWSKPGERTMRDQARAYLHEAAEIYLQTAERNPLRLYRATFYTSAAAAYTRSDDHERAHSLLTKAVRQAPYSSMIWSRLASADLRLGRTEESTRAQTLAAQWMIPKIAPQ